MKKGWKIFGIVCAVIAGLGIILCIAGFAIGVSDQEIRAAFNRGIGFRSYNTHTETEVLRTDGDDLRPVYEGIRNLDVEVGRMQVNVSLMDDDGGIRVEQQTHKDVNLQCYQEGDTLKIEASHGHRRINHEGIVHIYIPKDLVLQKAEFSIGAGVLYADRITADQIDIECGAGQVELTAGGQESDYNYDLEIGAGEVTIGGGTFAGLAVERKIDNHAKKEISVECGAGQVSVAFEQ